MRFPWYSMLAVAALIAGSLLLSACGKEEKEEVAAPAAATEVATPTAVETEEAMPSPTAVLPSPTIEQPAATAPAEEPAGGEGGAGRGVPMFRGNPAHTGLNPGPGVERSPKLLWRFQTGGGDVSSPAVVGEVVYVGSKDNHVYALDAATGEERWRFQTGSIVRSSPAVVDGVVYVGSNDGYVYAITEE